MQLHYPLCIQALNEVTDLAGHFVVNDQDTNKIFIRITRRRRPLMNIEYKVIEYLLNKNIKINAPIIKNVRMQWQSQQFAMEVYPFIAGRHYNGDLEDLKILAKNLSRLHRVLKRFPMKNRVRLCTEQREKSLHVFRNHALTHLNKNNYAYFQEYETWVKKHKEWLNHALNQFRPVTSIPLDDVQCTHGDLHIGNVIFLENDKEAIFTDFEEVGHSWLPLTYDLAYLIQRFCLLFVKNENDLALYVCEIRNSYGHLSPAVLTSLNQICFRAIILNLYHLTQRASIVGVDELDKFIYLHQLTHQWITPQTFERNHA